MPYGLGAVCVYQRLGQRVCRSAAKAGYWDMGHYLSGGEGARVAVFEG